MTMARTEQRGGMIDRAGAVASSACAVHCVLCALLPGVLGAVGLGALLGHEAEWGLTLVAIVFASVALLLGWRKHRSWLIAISLSVGIAGLLLSRVLEDAGGPVLGTGLGILAGVVLVIGHVWNLRASRRCQTACS